MVCSLPCLAACLPGDCVATTGPGCYFLACQAARQPFFGCLHCLVRGDVGKHYSAVHGAATNPHAHNSLVPWSVFGALAHASNAANSPALMFTPLMPFAEHVRPAASHCLVCSYDGCLHSHPRLVASLLATCTTRTRRTWARLPPPWCSRRAPPTPLRCAPSARSSATGGLALRRARFAHRESCVSDLRWWKKNHSASSCIF